MYTRENYLARVAEVQQAYQEAKKESSLMKYQRAGGYTKRWIYKHRIKPRFHIGYATFDKYLSIDAVSELDKLKQL